MLDCIIIDDEDHAIKLLKFYIDKTPDMNLIATFTDPFEAISFLEHTAVDLILLDIQMPSLSGIEFIGIIKKPVNIILTTAFREFAMDGFDIGVVDFLLKPISFDRFVKAIYKVHSIKRNSATQTSIKNDFIVVKTESKNKLHKVNLSEILYVEGLKNYISIFTIKQRIVALLNIKLLEEKLPAELFIRTHKSYIVSLPQIKLIDGNLITLKDVENTIPIGETYRKNLLSLFSQKLIKNE